MERLENSQVSIHVIYSLQIGSYVQVEHKSKKQMFQDEMQRVKSRLDEERALSQSLQNSKKTLEQEIQALQKEKQAFEEELKQLKSMVFQVSLVFFYAKKRSAEWRKWTPLDSKWKLSTESLQLCCLRKENWMIFLLLFRLKYS